MRSTAPAADRAPTRTRSAIAARAVRAPGPDPRAPGGRPRSVHRRPSVRRRAPTAHPNGSQSVETAARLPLHWRAPRRRTGHLAVSRAIPHAPRAAPAARSCRALARAQFRADLEDAITPGQRPICAERGQHVGGHAPVPAPSSSTFPPRSRPAPRRTAGRGRRDTARRSRARSRIPVGTELHAAGAVIADPGS